MTSGDHHFPPALMNFDDFFRCFRGQMESKLHHSRVVLIFFINFGDHRFPPALISFDDFFVIKLSPNYIIVGYF